MTEEPVSLRVADARRRAVERRARQRARLRPATVLAIAFVVAAAVSGTPAPAAHGKGLAVTVAVVVFAAGVASMLLRSWVRWPAAAEYGLPIVVGVAAVALAALQPRGPVEVGAAIAIWLVLTRLPLVPGLALAVAITIGLDVAIAAAGTQVARSVAAATLLCILLALTARFVRQSTESRDELELVLAELEDARDAQAEAAALAERGRIARDLHDVLAHSLASLSIQLEGAQLLVARGSGDARLAAALERASQLVKDGIVDAKRAVGALRDERPPGVDDLAALVDRFRTLGLDVELRVEGERPELSRESELALYRSAQEGLTNASRYARDAHATVWVKYARSSVALVVDDDGGSRNASAIGGGRGLVGMRERVEAVGGRVSAGPTSSGFRVEVEVPV